jgi:perosamine synthetase
MERIPFCSPSINAHDVQHVAESVSHCSSDHAGDYQHRFERNFADFLGVRFAHAVSSRSAATHVAFAALGISAGDEVIVPDLAPLASLLPLRYLGAVPVFVDVAPQTMCISVESFKKALTPRTKAVMAVDLFGAMAEMHRLRAIARIHGIAIVEDASDALGGEYLGRNAGSLGDIGIFGFDRTETLTSAEGGMVVTNCEQTVVGIQESIQSTGFDYHISPMQAALGVSQLERIKNLIERKRQIEARYQQALKGLKGVQFTSTSHGSTRVANEVTVSIEPHADFTTEQLFDQLAGQGVECRMMLAPASSHAIYDDLLQARVARSRNRVSYALGRQVLSLPSGTNLTDREIDNVSQILRAVVSSPRQYYHPISRAA